MPVVGGPALVPVAEQIRASFPPSRYLYPRYLTSRVPGGGSDSDSSPNGPSKLASSVHKARATFRQRTSRRDKKMLLIVFHIAIQYLLPGR